MRTLIYIYILFICASCAQITPLTGGKKDDSPPLALSFKPENATLNFNVKTIEIQFNEYIALKDLNNQLIVTPQLKEMPNVEVSGKKIKITINEDLIPNTTYKFSFGNSIVDLNESNVLQNFEYIFSTGNSIDSLSLTGQVINAFDNIPRKNALVGLFNEQSSDSVIYKEKPLYIHKTDDYGKYKFTYLPNKHFKIIAINDKNKNLMYDGSEEEIAFLDKDAVSGDTIPQKLLMFREEPHKKFIKRSYLSEPGKLIIAYNTRREDLVNLKASNLIKYVFNNTKDTMEVYFRDNIDTLKTYVYYKEQKADTINIKIATPKTDRGNSSTQTPKYHVRSNINKTLPFYTYPKFKLNFPVRRSLIDTSLIKLQEKQDSGYTVVPYILVSDTGYVTKFDLQAQLKPETDYTLSILPKALSQDEKRVNDSTILKFTTTVIDDYAQLNLKLFFPKKETYIIQLLDDKGDVIEEEYMEMPMSSTSEQTIVYKNIQPGVYHVKVIEDRNKNKRFDVGNYLNKTQPEIIYILNTSIKLMAGWEIEHEWKVQ